MKKFKSPLDDEEKELLDSFEKGEWKSVKNIEKEKRQARQIASQTMKKNVRINIRLAEPDLFNIKMKAAYEGIPYQTLISSILHKYASGHL